ncbi:MAG: hypothetical protein MK102_13660 [Fuerstiella sp.]|nr:hypothetical protein [Fuerstiella sp.]
MSVDTSESTQPDACRELLGYLNFSDGTPSPSFQTALNGLFSEASAPVCPEDLRDQLLSVLNRLQASDTPGFNDTMQAANVVSMALCDVIPAYRQHHSDLLFHLSDADFFSPLFLGRVFEATLRAGSRHGWNKSVHLLTTALELLNQFVGYRPVAVLENDRKAEVYGRERFCPIPLYLRGVGVAVGPWKRLLESTLDFLRELPEDLTAPAHFNLSRMEELSLDVRAHDHLHPVNKRTNYMFGEWDPDLIDTKGFYRRFVIRSIILDSLLDWLQTDNGTSPEERLFDSSAVLAGTILMASSISGSGPQTFDSGVSLTSLLPTVARQRDAFYQTLLNAAQGERRERLERLTEESRQPFGHVRHELNMNLSRYGAQQVQHRHLSWLYASMGFEAASREEARVIPCTSARFESEICSRLMLIHRLVRSNQLAEAVEQLRTCHRLLQAGIQCGGFVDPWNILGFQGMFPLFTAREDAIPDNRVEILMDVMEQIFDSCSFVMAEAAAAGQTEYHQIIYQDFQKLADQWDQYATTTVTDLPEIRGRESVAAAEHVAAALVEWRTAGEAAADISFWKNHVDQFESARSFSQVVSSLLDRDDLIAATGLLIQWLSQAEAFGLESGRHSIHTQFQRLLNLMTQRDDLSDQWQLLRRLFSFLEANAGEYWLVPSLGEFADRHRNVNSADDRHTDLDHLFDDDQSEDEAWRESAFEGIVYRDSTDDGNESDTVDEGLSPGTTEFEILYRQIEPRLKFLHTLGSLYSNAAIALARRTPEDLSSDEIQLHLREWESSIRHFLEAFSVLLREISDFEIQTLSADLEANIEFDVQMQSRFLLMQNAISTTVQFLLAERLLGALLPASPKHSTEADSQFSDHLIRLLRSVLTDDSPAVQVEFPEFLKQLRRRPLLYVPFENGGNPRDILRARTLQAIIRLLLGQLPRLGLLQQTYQLLQTACRMERTRRPPGLAVTEFDRLFRMGLTCSVEAMLHAAKRWKLETTGQRKKAHSRIQRLMDSYGILWAQHSSSMRLSIVEELHDKERCQEVREFIEAYGDDLFHTRMLTLGNARAIVVHGADSLLNELESNVAPYQKIRVIEDLQQGRIDRDHAIDIMEFVYESVVDNFDVFLEYNTTTTQSDYGNRLYCLLDFLRIKSLYDRFEWNHLPYHYFHEVVVRNDVADMGALIEEELTDETRESAESLVEELHKLEVTYGVRLPTMHDLIGDRLIGPLQVNRMTARVALCNPELPNVSEEEAKRNFRFLRDEIDDYMEGRQGSGIETPEWMNSLGREQARIQDQLDGIEPSVLDAAEFKHVTPRELDRQLAEMLDDEV